MSESSAPTDLETVAPRLIVGLGNPGKNYEETRHNIGFMVLDALAERLGTTFSNEKRWKSHVAKLPQGWLLKPQTYMNESGRAVSGVSRFYKVEPAETLVVYDDVDLTLGRLRLRPQGSAGGHNGIRSIINHLGGTRFPRLKVGIATESGRPAGSRMTGHVLGRFSSDEKAHLAQVIDRAVEAIQAAMQSGLGPAMNLFNRKEDA